MRKYHQNREAIYPIDEWKIIEEGYQPQYNHRNETIFALGNGYLGLRGTLEEGFHSSSPSDAPATTPGTYINGVYDSERINYGEYVYGMPEYSQSLLNLAAWQIIRLAVDGDWFDLESGQVADYQRVLDLQRGTLTRSLIWTSPKGHQIKIRIVRCISLTDQHQAVIRYSVTPLNFSGQITFQSELDGAVQNHHFLAQRVLQTLETEVNGDEGMLLQQTSHSKITIGCGVAHQLFLEENNGNNAGRGKVAPNSDIQPKSDQPADARVETQSGPDSISFTYTCQVEANQTMHLEKYVTFYTSRDLPEVEIKPALRQELAKLKRSQAAGVQARQAEYLRNYWQESDVQITGDPTLQQGIRFNAFQLLQSCGQDGKTSIGAKGITGEWYEGHYFWDTEIYINPFFLYSQPELVKQLLLYRYSILDQARQRAQVMGHKGALYAWRTINGHEASALFEGSTAQYHINGAITYAVYKYMEATEDRDFLVQHGAEIIFETARCWADRGGFIPLKGNKFCINEVCGPDEYKAGVNNNCYTNYMAQFNLQLAVNTAQLLQKEHSEAYQTLQEKINLQPEEITYWQRCAEEMYLPFSEELGIHPQDDSFLYKEELDIDAIPPEQVPLVRNWHPLNIWRYQVCKQADVILLMLLHGNRFDQEVKKANYDYYEPRTTHDSSLSSCIFSIIASEVGYRQPAYDYFMQTARLDLDDYNNNVHEGIHAACMAGSWMCMTYGFAGMRIYDGEIIFNPYLPDGWEGYQFAIQFRGHKLEISIDQEEVTYSLTQGSELRFYHGKEELILQGQEVAKRPLVG